MVGFTAAAGDTAAKMDRRSFVCQQISEKVKCSKLSSSETDFEGFACFSFCSAVYHENIQEFQCVKERRGSIPQCL